MVHKAMVSTARKEFNGANAYLTFILETNEN
jgi:hypothetical protein